MKPTSQPKDWRQDEPGQFHVGSATQTFGAFQECLDSLACAQQHAHSPHATGGHPRVAEGFHKLLFSVRAGSGLEAEGKLRLKPCRGECKSQL